MLVKQLPNAVTAIRFFLTPLAVHALFEHQDRTALWLCLAASASDFADGMLARWLKVTSRTGAILDPLADKFMLDVLYLTLWLSRGHLVGIVVILRDVLIVAGAIAIFLRTGRRDFPPSWLGKISTVIQMGWLVAYLAGLPGTDYWTALLVAAAVASGIGYLLTGWRMIRAGIIPQ